MLEVLANLGGGELVALVAVTGGLLLAVLAVIASQWRLVRIAELETGLKQSMLEKNMSAADIEQVMNAGKRRRDEAGFSSSGSEAQGKDLLAQRMIDNGYEGDDIERVLRAYEPTPKPMEESVS